MLSFYAESAGTLWLGTVSRREHDQWADFRLLLPKTTSAPVWSPDGTQLAAILDGAVVVTPYPSVNPRVLFQPPTATQPTRIVV